MTFRHVDGIAHRRLRDANLRIKALEDQIERLENLLFEIVRWVDYPDQRDWDHVCELIAGYKQENNEDV